MELNDGMAELYERTPEGKISTMHPSTPHPHPHPPSALIIGGVSWDSVIRVSELPGSQPQTVFAKAAWESVGSTGAGKALNLRRLGWATTLHAQLGDDDAGRLALQAL